MERRTALALAVAAAGTVLAGSAAFAANVGLLENDAKPTSVLDTSSVETTTTVPQDPTVVTVIVEDPPATASDDGVPAVDPAVTTPPASVGQSYDDSSDDEYEDDEHEDSEHEDEYEDSEDHESDDDD